MVSQITKSIVSSNNTDLLSYNAGGKKLSSSPVGCNQGRWDMIFFEGSWAELSLLWPLQASRGSPYLLAYGLFPLYSHPRLDEHALDHSSDAHSVASPFNLLITLTRSVSPETFKMTFLLSGQLICNTSSFNLPIPCKELIYIFLGFRHRNLCLGAFFFLFNHEVFH